VSEKGPLVVIVDDDPDILEIQRSVLEARGYVVLCFADPDAALEQMRKEKPALIIADLMMASLDSGFSFSRQVKTDRRLSDVPIVMMTSIGPRLGLDFTPQAPEDLAAMHVDAFLEKPVSPSVLLSTIDELLGPPKSLGGNQRK
jgi:CheY-like chemotaxis protein